MEPLLKIKDLKTYFYTYEGVVKAVNGVNLELKKQQELLLNTMIKKQIIVLMKLLYYLHNQEEHLIMN